MLCSVHDIPQMNIENEKKQADKQAGRQAGKQVSTYWAFSQSNALQRLFKPEQDDRTFDMSTIKLFLVHFVMGDIIFPVKIKERSNLTH